MAEPSLSSLIMWSIITCIAMLVVGFSYSVYLKRHADGSKDEYDIDNTTTTAAATTISHPPTKDTDMLHDHHPAGTLDTDEIQSQLSPDTTNTSQSDVQSNVLSDTSPDTDSANHDTTSTKTTHKSEQIND